MFRIPAATGSPSVHAGGFFCRVFYMLMFFNVLLAALVAAVAYHGDAHWTAALVVFWFAFRVETALWNQMAMMKVIHVLLANENRKLEQENAEREALIAQIARNN